MALFYAAIREYSVSLLRFPFPSHVLVFFWEISQLCRLKYPYCCFSFHFCFLVIAMFSLVLTMLLLAVVVFESSHWFIHGLSPLYRSFLIPMSCSHQLVCFHGSQVFLALLEFSLYSSWTQQYCGLNVLDSSSDFIWFNLLSKFSGPFQVHQLRLISPSTHVQHLFKFFGNVQLFAYHFTYFYFDSLFLWKGGRSTVR